MALSLNKPKLDNLAGDIWKSAERLRGKFKAYEYQSVILPIIVIRRLECVLLAWREAKSAEVLAKPIIRWAGQPATRLRNPAEQILLPLPAAHAREGSARGVLEAGEGGGEDAGGIGEMKKSQEVSIASPEYRQFIEELKARVLSARISAARAVNRDLILLYWDIGRGIVEKQQTLGWGDSVVEMVAADLRQAFPAHDRLFTAQCVATCASFIATYTDYLISRTGCARNRSCEQAKFCDKLSQN